MNLRPAGATSLGDPRRFAGAVYYEGEVCFWQGLSLWIGLGAKQAAPM